MFLLKCRKIIWMQFFWKVMKVSTIYKGPSMELVADNMKDESVMECLSVVTSVNREIDIRLINKKE